MGRFETGGNIEAAGYTCYLPLAVHNLNADRLAASTEGEGPRDPLIVVVTDGWARLLLDGVERKLERGAVLCCNSRSRPKWLETRTFKGIAIEYREMTLDGGRPMPSELPVFPLSGAQETLTLAQRMEAAWKDRQTAPLEPQRLLLELLARLFEQRRTVARSGATWLVRVLDLMHRRCREEWTREALAEYAGVSAEHFSRVFRKATGMTFTAYLGLLRIRKAQLCLLKGGTNNLNELARRVGYRDGYYLSKKFKSVIGMAPASYLRKPRRIVAANYNHTEMLMELGVRPVLGAYSSWSNHRIAAGHEAQELNWAEGRGSYTELERLKPDIIIGYSLLEEDRRLLRYAAVEAIPLLRLSWREQFRIIADIAGRRERAEERLAQYDAMAAEANTRLDKCGISRGTAAVWEIYSDVAYVFDASYGRGAQVLYGDLGFRMPDVLRRQSIEDRGFLSCPVQAVSDIDCDYLFIIVARQESSAVRQLFQSSGWRSLEAVRAGKVYMIDDFDRFYGFDPRSTEHQLQCLLEWLTS